MASRPEQLYEEDFYAWTRRQATALRRLAETRPDVDLDLPHLIEEVADLGISQRDAVRSQVRRIVEHCLKLEHSPAQAPRAGWHETIIQVRTEIEDKITPRSGASCRGGFPDFGSRPGATRRPRSASTASTPRPTPCRPNARTAWPTSCARLVSPEPPWADPGESHKKPW